MSFERCYLDESILQISRLDINVHIGILSQAKLYACNFSQNKTG